MIILLLGASAFGRGQSGMPFLLISPAPDGNGRGNTSTAVPSDNAIATAVNPGMLGLFSLDKFFSGSTYLGKVDWLPVFSGDITYNVRALSGGFNSSELFSLPFSVSVGLGYSKTDLDLGEFVLTGSGRPDEIARFNTYEQAENFSLGFGIDYFVKLGLGWNFKTAKSNLGFIGTEQELLPAMAEASMADFGVILQAPGTDILERATGDTARVLKNLSPIFDLNFGYVVANRSDEVVTYLDTSQSDPLPRNAITGLSLRIGLVKEVRGDDWTVFSFTIAREAEDLLVTRESTGAFGYKSGWGDISFFKNVIGGRSDDCVNLRKGWELNFGDFVLVRGGSYWEGDLCGRRQYSTSGLGIRLRGLLAFLHVLSTGSTSSGVLGFLADHVDLVYDYATYSGDTPLDGTVFSSLTLIIE